MPGGRMVVGRAAPAVPGSGQPDGPALDFHALYRTQWWPMVRLATGLVDDAASAEDVVQDAFSAMFRRIDNLRDTSAAVAYLRTCVVNAARSELRHRGVSRRHLRSVSVSAAEHAESADQSSLLGAEHAMVQTALQALPRRQAEILTLRYVAELADAEIARTLGLSEGSVRSAASRGLAALRSALGGQL